MLVACTDDAAKSPIPDAGHDATVDSGTLDSGLDAATDAAHEAAVDASSDAGVDATTNMDAAAVDGGDVDASVDASSGDDASATEDGGLPGEWRECTTHSDCVLTVASCCQPCGRPGIDALFSVNSSSYEAQREAACEGHPGFCPACVSQRNPNVVAICASGLCTARDIRTEPYTGCERSEDCRTRSAACCECENAASGLYVAVNASIEALTEYESIVCNETTACSAVGACEAYPETAPIAYCDTETSHCVLPEEL